VLRYSILACVAALALLPRAAMAHPHVFIDNQVVLQFAGGKLAGFRTDWRFDEIFTEDMLMQFDKDGDGTISAAESEVIGSETLPNLASFRYFTRASVDGTDFPDLVPAAFHARVEEGALHYELTFALPEPIDPRRQKLRLEISDRDYYVEVLMAETDPVRVEGEGSAGCEGTVKDDPENAYYEGFVIPQAISVQCR
jgi:ABC-type uncharacterized transport system substrate-binding protein